MKHTVKLLVVTMVILGGSFYADAGTFSLSSPQIEQNGKLNIGQVFSGFGCTGKNISPALEWNDPPEGTKSYALTVYDPDAPTGSGWWHWVIFNIPLNTKGLAENAGDPLSGLAPVGSIQSRTDFGKSGYGGACPPAGDKPHRYIFTVYALDTEQLDVDSNASGAMVGFFLNQHAVAKTSITALYNR